MSVDIFDHIFGRFKVTTKAHSGAMVALMLDPSDSAALLSALPKGLTAETDLHVTLAYLGKAADLDDTQRAAIDVALAALGQSSAPVTGLVQGIGYFNQDEAGQRVLYGSFDSPALPALRQAVVGALEGAGLPPDDTHGFTPHITLAYVPGGEPPVVPDLPALKITFPALTRMYAGERGDFPLGEPTAAAEKEHRPMNIIDHITSWAGRNKEASESLTEREQKLRSAFYSQFAPRVENMALPASSPYVNEIYDDHVIVSCDGQDYSVDLTQKDGEITYAPFTEWAKVERVWQAQKAAAAGPLMVFKESDDKYRWVLFSSSAFEDRDREVVSQKALQADCDRADADGQYGPLRWWHLPDANIGDCDFNMVHGRVLIESGTFRNARVGRAVKEHAAELGVSIGFNHPISEPDANGVFEHVHRFERSLLPREVASNTLSAVPRIEKESQMTTMEDKLKAFGQLLKANPETVKEILDLAESKEKSAAEAGTRFKELGDAAKPGEIFEHAGATYIKTAAGEAIVLKAASADAAPNGESAKRDKPFSKDQATDDEAPAGGDEPDKGKKTKALADELKAVLEPFAADVETRVKTLLTEQASTKAAADAETFKGLRTTIEQASKDAKAALDGVKDLKGEQPRRFSQYRASQEGEAPNETQKEQQPVEDPFAKHFKAINAAAGAPAAN